MICPDFAKECLGGTYSVLVRGVSSDSHRHCRYLSKVDEK